MTSQSPENYYLQRIQELNTEKARQLKKKSGLAWYRFFSIVAAFTALSLLWPQGELIALTAFLLLVGLFIYFLKQDINNNNAIENTSRLITINETEIQVLHHQYTQLDNGSRYQADTHAYTNDLDIFGRASLYQYINRSCSEQGGAELAG